MRKFAWITFLTGLALSVVAGFYSVVGLAMIFSGAYWPVIVMSSMLELAKIVAVSWMYRYRQLAGHLLRIYFVAAIAVLMCVTSMGIFGYLTRAHVESETGYTTAQLTLQEVQLRETQLQDERRQIATELAALTEQSTQLVSQLGSAQRLRGTQGAVEVQRENATRRAALLTETQRITEALTAAQKDRILIEAETNKATADIGPLRYVAQAVYGTDDITTIRKSAIWLTLILMVVFDPMAIMLLIAANILFTRLSPIETQPHNTVNILDTKSDIPPVSLPIISAPAATSLTPPEYRPPTETVETPETNSPHISDVPQQLIRNAP